MSKNYGTTYDRAVAKHGPRVEWGTSRLTHTYFIQGETTRLVKIGRTNGSPAKRLTELQPYSPDKLTILAWVKADIESECHEAFAYCRAHGEWFKPGTKLMDFIAKIRSGELLSHNLTMELLSYL